MRIRFLLGLIIATSAFALPIATSAAEPAVASGSELFQRYCASCHGRTARGDGPVASSLKAVVPNLRRIAERHDGKFPEGWVYRVIDGRETMMAHGPREMPIWGYEFWHESGADVEAGRKASELIDRLVAYLKGIQIVPDRDPAQSN